MKKILSYNKLIIITQILLILLNLDYPYLMILFLYLLMIEYVVISNVKLLHFYNSYISIKLLFTFTCLIIDLKYIGLIALVLFQHLLYFYTKVNIEVLTKTINKYLALMYIPIFLFFVFQNASIYDIFLIYPILYSCFIFIKSIQNSDEFCVKSEFTSYQLVDKIKKTPVSFLYFVIVIYIKILYGFSINFDILLSLCIILLISIKIEYQHVKDAKSQHNITTIPYYMFSLVTLLLFCLFIFLIKIEPLDINDVKQYASNIYASITNIAILNIASLFVLIQLNYQKFGSAYLLKKMFQTPTLLLITLLPAIFLVLRGHILISDIPSLPSILLSCSFGSTLFLFTYAYLILDANIVMRSLFQNINYTHFKNYKKNVIHQKETNIDTTLKIIATMLKNNDTAISHSVFYNFACWVKHNITSINQMNHNDFDVKNNKFYDFFMILVSGLINSKEIVFHQNFIFSIRNIVMKNVTFENFQEHKILYSVLFEYLYLALKNRNEQIAEEIYRTIYWNASQILFGLSKCEIDRFHIIKKSDCRGLWEFENIFVEPYRKIINIGIENKNLTFLSSLLFYDDLFIAHSLDDKKLKENYENWDGKVLEIFTSTRFSNEQLYLFLVDNSEFFPFSIRDYRIFLPYSFYSQDKNIYQYDEIIIKYVIHRIISIYEYAITKNKINHDMDFELIWVCIFSTIKNNDIENFKIYITIFTYLLKKACEKYADNIHDSKAINVLWNRLLHIKGTLNKDNDLFINFIQQKINKLEQDYSDLKNIVDTRLDSKRITEINVLNDYDI